MDVMHDIELSLEKFNAVRALRELLMKLDQTHYCTWGSFLSSVLFQSAFSGSFDILTKDENDTYDALGADYKIDSLHGTIILDGSNVGEAGSLLKIRVIDSHSKNTDFRNFLIDHSDLRTCAVVSPSGEMEKIEVPIPRRGAVLLLNLIEAGEEPQAIASVVEKILWSLGKVGVAPLLRDSRFVSEEHIYSAAAKIEELLVVRANKTATLLHAHGSQAVKSITAAELKKMGRPYAALLRA